MKPTVLFIEDDGDQMNLYKTKFELEGFDFICACNGSEGLEAARKKKPDLIFLDVVLRNENGLDVLKKLKQEKSTRGIPVTIFTNLSTTSTRDEGIKFGAVAYLVKTDITLKELIGWAKSNVRK